MEDVIAPISKELLKAELTEEKRLRMTNRSHNQIYIITAQDSPNTMKEIGRLREIAFRAAGGGTGKSMDIDEYDIMDNPYKQLIVWNPEAEEILGGYRYVSKALNGRADVSEETRQTINAVLKRYGYSRKATGAKSQRIIEIVFQDFDNVWALFCSLRGAPA